MKSARVSDDGYSVFLELSDVIPVMQQRIKLRVKARNGSSIEQDVYQTIHRVPAL